MLSIAHLLRPPARRVLFGVVLFAFVAGPALAQAPDSADTRVRIEPGGPDRLATEVFVLGTPHLSRVADRFEDGTVDRLIADLDAFGPDAVAVEQLPGRQVAAMERWGGALDRVTEQFASTFLEHGHRVRQRAGGSWTEANQRADSLLAVVRSAENDASARDRLALVRSLVGAYRLPSAALQWRHLPLAVRDTQTAVPDTTAAALSQRLGAANEVYSIGLRLAHRRSHQRLYPIDYHAEKDQLLSIYAQLQQSAFVDSVRTAMQNAAAVQRQDSLMQAGLEQGNLLPAYRYANSQERGRADVRLQWQPWLRADLPDGIGRTRLALWETRNLHMVGQIQRVVAQHPGGRVLVIVGAAHKPFFDAYLQRMMGVHVVDARRVLGGS
jgi:hypothetical protein